MVEHLHFIEEEVLFVLAQARFDLLYVGQSLLDPTIP
jgi:hypothetical protein